MNLSEEEINELFEFRLEPPDEDKLIEIFKHFLKIVSPKYDKDYIPMNNDLIFHPYDLGKLPNKNWYKKLDSLINEYGRDLYQNLVKEYFIKINHLIKIHNEALSKKKKEEKKFKTKVDIQKFGIPKKWEIGSNSPLHFYFYCSAKGRYLKGLILSIGCVPNLALILQLREFAFNFPFLVGSKGIYPTGLYIYDVMEVFSKLPSKDAKQLLNELHNKIKNKWGKMRVDKYLNHISEK